MGDRATRFIIQLVMKLQRSPRGCFILTIYFLLVTVFVWLMPLDDEIFFVRWILTGVFISFGLTFCIIGVIRLKEKNKN